MEFFGITLVGLNAENAAAFEEAGIGIASATYDIVGFPPIRVENARQAT